MLELMTKFFLEKDPSSVGDRSVGDRSVSDRSVGDRSVGDRSSKGISLSGELPGGGGGGGERNGERGHSHVNNGASHFMTSLARPNTAAVNSRKGLYCKRYYILSALHAIVGKLT